MSASVPQARLARAFRGVAARLSLALLALFVLTALVAPEAAPYSPNAQPNADTGKNQPPSRAHPFGTDLYSRDVLSRVMHGARVSLGVAAQLIGDGLFRDQFLLQRIAGFVLVVFGALAGFAGGWVDAVCMRMVDALLSVPRLLLLIVIVASTGQLPVAGLILLLGFTSWPGMSRIVRGEVRVLRVRDFVLSARASGVPERRILVSHVLPGVVPQVLVAATLALASVIPLEAGLSYLGFGVRLPTPSWGNIIREGSDSAVETWWMVLFPGLAIVATVLAVNTLGERMREALDPHTDDPR